MDETEDEKITILESIRLQEEALSSKYTIPLVNLDNVDSDGEEQESDTSIENLQLENVCPGISTQSLPASVSCDNNKQEECDKKRTVSDALSANLEYDQQLEKFEMELKRELANINQNINYLDEKIKSVSSHVKRTKSTNYKSNWLYVFGIPYFKDQDFYPCPPNEDFKKKRANDEICWVDLPDVHQWLPGEKQKLVKVVKELAWIRCLDEADAKLKSMKQRAQNMSDSDNHLEAKKLQEEIASFDAQRVAEENFQHAVETGPHDWLTISNKYMDSRHCAGSCEAFWNVYLHPKINKSPWTSTEEDRLKKIARDHKLEDWDTIAKMLGTNRSGYQCFITYQTKLNETLKRIRWTEEEDSRLIEVIKKCRIGDYIPWGKVSFYMDGRTKNQVFNRWTYSLNPVIKKGRFTKQEDMMIIVGVKMWGEDFTRIANFMQDRTTCQVRDRFRNYLTKADLGLPWSHEEDVRLYNLVQKHGRDWSLIAKSFPDKDRTQARQRYNTLANWRAKNPGKEMCSVPNRKSTSGGGDYMELWEKAKTILTAKTVDELVSTKEDIVATCNKHKLLKKNHTRVRGPTLAEADLINFFRCSYPIPGGRKKTSLRAGEVEQLADDLNKILLLMGADLNLPSSEEMDADPELSDVDRQILVEYRQLRSISLIKESPPESPDVIAIDSRYQSSTLFEEPSGTTYDGPSTSFGRNLDISDVEQQFMPDRPETPPNIDYDQYAVPVTSSYVDLPILNFTQDEVVLDMPVPRIKSEPTENFSRTISPPLVPKRGESEKLHFCPPNFTTLVGLRTFLLNRRGLADTARSRQGNPTVSGSDSVRYREASRLFERRMMFLFLWPGIMSRSPPSDRQIFLDQEDPPVGTSLLPVGKTVETGKATSRKARKRVQKSDPAISTVVTETATSLVAETSTNISQPQCKRLKLDPVVDNGTELHPSINHHLASGPSDTDKDETV